MKGVIAYLLAIVAALCFGIYLDLAGLLPSWVDSVRVAYRCTVAGGFGGALYCLRGVYLNRAVRNSWDDRWLVWYYLRPLGSLVCGAIAYLFVRAGLLVLESAPNASSSELGFMALAFIAGLNVDRFVEKLEDIAQASWGIKKSRTAVRDDGTDA